MIDLNFLLSLKFHWNQTLNLPFCVTDKLEKEKSEKHILIK